MHCPDGGQQLDSAAFLAIYPDAPELEDFGDFEDDEER